MKITKITDITKLGEIGVEPLVISGIYIVTDESYYISEEDNSNILIIEEE